MRNQEREAEIIARLHRVGAERWATEGTVRRKETDSPLLTVRVKPLDEDGGCWALIPNYGWNEQQARIDLILHAQDDIEWLLTKLAAAREALRAVEWEGSSSVGPVCPACKCLPNRGHRAPEKDYDDGFLPTPGCPLAAALGPTSSK